MCCKYKFLWKKDLKPAWLYFFCTWVPDRIISLTLISLSNRKYRKVEVTRWRKTWQLTLTSQGGNNLGKVLWEMWDQRCSSPSSQVPGVDSFHPSEGRETALCEAKGEIFLCSWREGQSSRQKKGGKGGVRGREPPDGQRVYGWKSMAVVRTQRFKNDDD